MSSYLPVLLYSVGANVVPDDSALTTVLPRGQVDYLSHDWEEEDVWRSWRNMTKQKNEIANGERLENASWRTWWKQRNKLGTISPETLNWLKDSDVTWLYGPLHTAVQWTPPPKPKPDETEHKMASTQDRLDLSEPKHKSILKYRTISEMLTGDLPSPLFSPAESDNELDGNQTHAREGSDADSSERLRRPSLSHTKSDTHITRWGPDRAFRKDSPPRVEPTGVTHPTSNNSDAPLTSLDHVDGGATSSGYFGPQVQGPNEQSSSGSSPQGGSTEITPTGSIQNGNRRKHITFNTFVEQCIAIDKPKSKDTAFGAVTEEEDGWHGRNDPAKAGYDDGYDEDGEDEFDGDWEKNECAIGTDSESDVDQEALIRGEAASDDEEDDDDDGVIHMRPRRDSFNNKSSARLRSSSKVSSSSSSSSGEYSSSSTSGPSGASHSPLTRRNVPPNIRRRRRSDGPNHILLPRKNSSSLPRNTSSIALNSTEKDMVSIAPIAPTMLKTGSQTSWDGFGLQLPYRHPASGEWLEGFGDEGFSDDGTSMRVGPGGAHLYFGNSSDSSEASTPVGLVYMPPQTSRYGTPRETRATSSTGLDPEAEVELREDSNQEQADHITRSEQEYHSNDVDKEYHHHEAYFSTRSDKDNVDNARFKSVPKVVRTPPAVQLGHDESSDGEEDAYDYFSGPDLGEDFAQHTKSSTTRRKPQPANDPASKTVDETKLKLQTAEEENRGRSRSRSRSRTPSPTYVPPSNAISVPGRSERVSPPSVSASSSSSLLSPPQRGRGSVPSDPPSSSRGRSSRTSSSYSDRSRSRSNHSSPLGSLSPEGIGSAYSANGRGGGDREREREPSSRTGGRGRERVERKLSHSVSPDAVTTASSSLGPDTASVASSSSSSQTIVPGIYNSILDVSERSASPTENPPDEELTRSTYPTPANSPVISMSGAAHAIVRMQAKPPINISDPQVSSPLLSYSSASSTEPLNVASTSSPSPQSQTRTESKSGAEDDVGVVGKAAGMVSSAGAYFGFWNNGNTL